MPTHAEQVDAVRRLVRESVQAVDALVPPALRAVVPALVQARDELRSDLQDWLATAKNGADRFTAADRQAALRALEGALEGVRDLHPAMASALAGQRHATGPLAISNLDNEIRRLSAIFGGGVPSIPNIKAAAIIAQGDKLLWKRHETSARRYAGAIGEDIKHLLSVGVAKGESFDQLVNRLRRIGSAGRTARPIEPGADSAEIAGGLFGRYRWWAERLVRTEGMNTYNVMHDESIAYANEHRPDGDEEYLRRVDAAADARVCSLCRSLDGKVTTIDGTFPGGYSSPPFHSCCRCTVLAWLRRWGNMKGETQINGPVPTPGPARSREAPEEMAVTEHHIGMGRIGVREEPEAAPAVAPHRARERVTEADAEEREWQARTWLAKQHAAREEAARAAAEANRPRGTTTTWQPGDELRRRQVVTFKQKTPKEIEDEERRREAEARARLERQLDRVRKLTDEEKERARAAQVEAERQAAAERERRRLEREAQDRALGLVKALEEAPRKGLLARIGDAFREPDASEVARQAQRRAREAAQPRAATVRPGVVKRTIASIDRLLRRQS